MTDTSEKTEAETVSVHNQIGLADLVHIMQGRARMIDRALEGNFSPIWLIQHIEGLLVVAGLFYEANKQLAEKAAAEEKPN